MNELFTSIRRTPYQSFAAFLVLFFTLFLAMALFVSLSFLYSLLGYVETRPQLTVYFQAKAEEAQITRLRDDLQASGKVLSVKYISKNEAFEIYKQFNKDNPLLLEMVSPDILPASLEVNTKSPTMLPEIASYVRKQPGVDDVDFQKNIVDKLLTLTSIVRKATIGLYAFLILMTVVVLTTTTLFKIAIKKDEIELQRLLGAGSFYIKRPFLMEALFFGFMAVVVAFSLLVVGIMQIVPYLQSYLTGITALKLTLAEVSVMVWPLSKEFLAATFIIGSVFGMTISFVASYIATEKYLT